MAAAWSADAADIVSELTCLRQDLVGHPVSLGGLYLSFGDKII